MITVFTRNWWKPNPAYPNGLEPDSRARKTTIARVETEEEARAICKRINDGKMTAKQHRLGRKAEFRAD